MEKFKILQTLEAELKRFDFIGIDWVVSSQFLKGMLLRKVLSKLGIKLKYIDENLIQIGNHKVKIYESCFLPFNCTSTLEDTKLETTISAINKVDFDLFLIVYYSHRAYISSTFSDNQIDKTYDEFEAVGCYCRIAFAIQKTNTKVKFLQSLH